MLPVGGRPFRARGTRERKGDDKSGRTRRIEKVAPVGPGNGIPVLDSARNPRHYHVTKRRRSAGGIVHAITNWRYRKDMENLSDTDMLQRREEIPRLIGLPRHKIDFDPHIDSTAHCLSYYAYLLSYKIVACYNLCITNFPS